MCYSCIEITRKTFFTDDESYGISLRKHYPALPSRRIDEDGEILLCSCSIKIFWRKSTLAHNDRGWFRLSRNSIGAISAWPGCSRRFRNASSDEWKDIYTVVVSTPLAMTVSQGQLLEVLEQHPHKWFSIHDLVDHLPISLSSITNNRSKLILHRQVQVRYAYTTKGCGNKAVFVRHKERESI